ncbi:MAG: hypothetical protein ABJA62_09660 [Luteimonas sp.]
MTSLSQGLQRIIDKFGQQKDVTSEMIASLRLSIESSPVLVEQMNQAVQEKLLKAFKPLRTDFYAGAAYRAEDNVIEVPLSKLTPPEKNRDFYIDDMTFVLGHEVQHGFNLAQREQEVQAARDDMRRIARDKDPHNDYNRPIADWQQAARKDEARAQLAGWNAALSQLQQSGKDVSLKNMYENYKGRASDFIDRDSTANRFTLKPGLHLNPDFSISPTPENVASMGQYYYDNPAKTVGHAKSTYSNYTGADAITQAIYVERHDVPRGQASQMYVDLQRLGMQEDKLERNGIDLRANIEREPRQRYYDTSLGQTREGYFDHTKDGRVASEQEYQYVPIAPSTASLAPTLQRNVRDADHPDHGLYAELKQRLPPETSEDRLVQITAACHVNGMRKAEQIGRIDVTDTAVFVQPSSILLAGSQTKVNITTPPLPQHEAMRQVETHDQQQAVQLAQFQAQQQQINAQAQQGPGMSL